MSTSKLLHNDSVYSLNDGNQHQPSIIHSIMWRFYEFIIAFDFSHHITRMYNFLPINFFEFGNSVF